MEIIVHNEQRRLEIRCTDSASVSSKGATADVLAAMPRAAAV